MSDVNSTGKLIYQLTPVSTLKDTDQFVVSSDNLTRSVELSTIRTAVTNNVYDKDYINDLNINLTKDINAVRSELTKYNESISEYRNIYDVKLEELRNDFTSEINNAKSEFNTTITNTSESLQEKITALDTKLTNQINALISYGTAVPTSISTKIYLQYF